MVETGLFLNGEAQRDPLGASRGTFCLLKASRRSPQGNRMVESFLGGFMSGFLARGFTPSKIRYGLYFTTTRLFGIDPGKNGGSTFTGTLAGYVEGQLMPNLSQEESAKVIANLDRVKDFAMGKEQIQSIELKRPGLLSSGHIVIHSNNGASVKIALRHKIAYDRLMQITTVFSPGIVSSS